MLKGVNGCILEPGCLATIAPFGQALCHGEVANEFFTGLMIGLLQCQCLVKDETARTGKAAHGALLLTIGHEFVLEGLASKHAFIVFLSIRGFNGIWLGDHDVVALLFRLTILTIDQLTLYKTRTAFAVRAILP